MNNINVIKGNKTISLFGTDIDLNMELVTESDREFICFIFSINNLDVSGLYKLNKFITYSVSGGVLSENIVKKLQEELEIIYLDNFY